MKKLMSVLLAVAMCLSLAVPAVAVEENAAVDARGSVDINYTLNHFDEVFGGADNSVATYSAHSDGIDYSYTLIPIEGTNSTEFNTELQFTLYTNGFSYPMTVTGISRKTQVNEELSVLYGGLVGTTTIDGTFCNVMVGFLKSIDSDTINVGVTILPLGAEDLTESARFNFGGMVIPVGALETTEAKAGGSMVARTSINQTEEYPNYRFYTNDVMGFSSYQHNRPNGVAQKCTVMYDDSEAQDTRVLLSVNSYMYNVKDSLADCETSLTTVSVGVDEVRIKLKRDNGGPSYIVNIDGISGGQTITGAMDDQEIDYGNIVFWNNMASIAMRDFEIGSLVVDAFLAAISSAGVGIKVNTECLGNEANIRFVNSIFASLSFDDVPFSVELNLRKGSTLTPFDVYTDVSYTALVSDTVSYQVFFYKATQLKINDIKF